MDNLCSERNSQEPNQIDYGFTAENIGEWAGFEKEVAEELNILFTAEETSAEIKYKHIYTGEKFSWGHICEESAEFLSKELSEKVEKGFMNPLGFPPEDEGKINIDIKCNKISFDGKVAEIEDAGFDEIIKTISDETSVYDILVSCIENQNIISDIKDFINNHYGLEVFIDELTELI